MSESRFAITFKTAIIGIGFLAATSICVRSIRNKVFKKRRGTFN